MSIDVFQQLVLSKGVKKVLDFQERGDIQLESCTAERGMKVFMSAVIPLIYIIDIVDQQKGDGDGLTNYQLNYVRTSPRKTIKFFHRRSACITT